MQVKNLRAYLANIEMSIKDFSEIIECDPSHLSRVMSGKVMPSPRLARDIRTATSGLIEFKTRVRKKNQKSQDPEEQQQNAIAI